MVGVRCVLAYNRVPLCSGSRAASRFGAEETGHTPGEVVGFVVVTVLLLSALALVAARVAWKRGYAPLQTFELGMNLYDIGGDDEASDSGSESDASCGPSADVSFDEGVVFDEDGILGLAIDEPSGSGAWPTASAVELGDGDGGTHSHPALQSALEEI